MVEAVNRSEEGVAVEDTGGGGSTAFAEFFAAEHDPLLRFCWGLTVDREAARDVAQETMERAWRDWDRVGAAGSNPAAWSRTVALNLVRSAARRRTTADAATPLLVPVSGAVDDPCGDPDLATALRNLPERQREAVALHHLVDLPVDEVAALMGVGASTVKVHLQRGRAALAAVLGMDEVPGAAANEEVGS